jgi:hypothetical protein
MKKVTLISAILFLTISYSYAQELGVRFGNISGGKAAVDVIFGTSKYTRIHSDVSFGNGGVGIDVLWDFLYRPIGGESVYWYFGAGAYTQIADPFWLGVAGEIGLEYRFNQVPIVLGADWRPALSIIEATEFHTNIFGINVRWAFGKR